MSNYLDTLIFKKKEMEEQLKQTRIDLLTFPVNTFMGRIGLTMNIWALERKIEKINQEIEKEKEKESNN